MSRRIRSYRRTSMAIRAMENLLEMCDELALKANTVFEEGQIEALASVIETEIWHYYTTFDIADGDLIEQIAEWEERINEMAKGTV